MVQGDLHLEGDLGTTSVDMKDPNLKIRTIFLDVDGIDPLLMAMHGVAADARELGHVRRTICLRL